jgi:glucose-6-phosphate dehydrogenase assembly protein OpcA
MSTSEQDAMGAVVPFAKIGDAMARSVCRDTSATPMRALVATVVAVGPADRLGNAAAALRVLGDAGTVRGILISEGNDPAPPARVSGNTVALHGLKGRYINNAVAALRLSSLPTALWWRGGRPDMLHGLATLADRVILDEPNPEPIWEWASRLFEDSAFSDMRWAQLTQFRALTAHFFDIAEVRAAASAFTVLQIRSGDRLSADLFAAWLTSTVQFGRRFTVDIQEASGVPIQEVRLQDGEQELVLRLCESRTCVETAVSVKGHRGASRVVPLGDQSLSGIVTQELRIRARDAAFERAVRSLLADRSRARR